MSKVEVNARGIKNRLKDVKPYRAIAEYIWNGFDAGANTINISFECSEIGDIYSLTIEDNGKGIPFSLLEKSLLLFCLQKKESSRFNIRSCMARMGLAD